MNTLNEYLPSFIVEEIDRLKHTEEDKYIKMIEYAIEHPNMGWDWGEFVKCSAIMKFINMYPNKPWGWNKLAYRCRLIRHFHTFLKRKVIRVTESGDPFKHVLYEL